MKHCLVNKEGTILKYNVNKPKVITGTQDGVYLPLEDNAPTIDTNTHKIAGSTYEVQSDKVVKTYTVEEISIEKQLETAKEKMIKIIKEECKAYEPVTINGITYNGGEGSASAISGAVQLAQKLGELEVSLWDIDNIVRIYILEEAFDISAQIAKVYRDEMLIRQNMIMQVNNATTLDELPIYGE